MIENIIKEVRATPVAERKLTTMYLLELVEKIEGIKKAYEAVKDAEVFEGMPTLEEFIEEAIDAVSDHESVTRTANVYRIHEAIVQSIAKMMDEEDIKAIYERAKEVSIFDSMDELIDYLKDELDNEDLYYVLHNYDLEGYHFYTYDGDIGAVETFYECEDMIENIYPDDFTEWLEKEYTNESNTQLFEQFLNSFDWIVDYSRGLTEIWNMCPIAARTYQEEKKEDDEIEATLLLDDEPVMINHETGEMVK